MDSDNICQITPEKDELKCKVRFLLNMKRSHTIISTLNNFFKKIDTGFKSDISEYASKHKRKIQFYIRLPKNLINA